jgi:uncharacterized SAM-binding protein YcdF (DUF218 family)
MSRGPRLIAVLGYSAGTGAELHPICAARLARAAELSTSEDVVVLSGWARTSDATPEAALMAAAWSGAAREVVVDPVARTTVENAHNTVNDVLRVGASEVLVVTSSWHARRARVAFRWLLRFTGVTVRSASPPGGSLAGSLRELPLWLLLPLQLGVAERRSWRI